MTIPQTIEIDLTDSSTREEIHDRLSHAFNFPAYYGKNWDAFDECIRDLDTPPAKIRIRGLLDLESRFPREARLLTDCLRDYTRTEEGRGVQIETD